MNIQIHGNHMTVTAALERYIEEKIGRLERYFDKHEEIDAHVNLLVEHVQHRVQVTLHVEGALLHAEAQTGDMYASVDLVEDKLHHQIGKHKSKLHGRGHDVVHRGQGDPLAAIE